MSEVNSMYAENAKNEAQENCDSFAFIWCVFKLVKERFFAGFAIIFTVYFTRAIYTDWFLAYFAKSNAFDFRMICAISFLLPVGYF